jgi:FMN phosphatase YigB (HAD superfamily)
MLRNIIFDFGNVLFDLELGRTGQQLREHLGAFYRPAWERLQRDRIFELYEVGGLSTDEFVEAVCHAADGRVAPEQVVAAWNSILLGMPPHRFELLLDLRRRGYGVFLLSNINELHAACIDDYFRRTYELHDFEARYFDAVYYSHLIRLRKPDREAFEYALADAELVAGETLFVDDLEVNVEAARAVGMKAVVHPVGGEIARAIEQYLAQ